MVKTPVNHTQRGTPYGAGVHVEDMRTWWAKTDCKTSLDFLGVLLFLFFLMTSPTATTRKRAPHVGCELMRSVEGLQEILELLGGARF